MEIASYILSNLSDIQNAPLLLIAIILVCELIVRLTPTEKDNSILNRVLLALIRVLDIVIPNKVTQQPGTPEKTRFSVKAFVSKIRKR